MNNITYLVKTTQSIVDSRLGREILLKRLGRRLYKSIVLDVDNEIHLVKMRKYQWVDSLFRRTIINFNKGYISKKVLDRLIYVLIEGAFHADRDAYRRKIREYEKNYGTQPPSFLVISPTQRCNLNCADCYACSDKKTTPYLSFEVFDKMVKEFWDDAVGRFIVISGGEPLMYKDGDKTLFDIFEKHQDMLFMFYTNGTLIDDKTALRLLEAGNALPAISIEGYESETDRRRGKGVFKRIISATDNLKKYGVPFILSLTATKQNVDILLSDEFYEYCFDEIGATFMWQFQLMPIGRGKSAFENVPDPKSRLELFRKWENLLEKKKYPMADFWNGGMLTNGCIAYGRNGGYFYIDWNGNIMPCVFVPYVIDNVNRLYANNKRLLDVLNAPMMVKGRKWQYETQLKDRKTSDNLLMPCSIRDHYDNFRKNIIVPGTKGADSIADEILLDDEYYRNMLKYDEELHKVTQKVWDKEYAV